MNGNESIVGTAPGTKSETSCGEIYTSVYPQEI